MLFQYKYPCGAKIAVIKCFINLVAIPKGYIQSLDWTGPLDSL